jgi:hypothetical protein
MTDLLKVFNKFRRPIIPALFVLGALLLLLGVTTGFKVPVLAQLVPNPDYWWVCVGIGVVFVLLAVGADSRSPGTVGTGGESPALPATPEELTWEFTARRGSISGSQKKLLGFIEGFGPRHGFVRQGSIEAEFPQFSKGELYYRLEQLRLLCFLEKAKMGQDHNGFDYFSYSLSADYRAEMARTPDKPPTVTFVP